MTNTSESENMTTIVDISKKLDVLMTKVDEISIQQSKTNKIVEKLHYSIYSCRQEIDQIRDFVFDTISPYLCELGDSLLGMCSVGLLSTDCTDSVLSGALTTLSPMPLTH